MSIYDEHEGIVCFSLAYLSFCKVYDIILRTIIKIIGLDWRMRGEVNMGKITEFVSVKKRGAKASHNRS